MSLNAVLQVITTVLATADEKLLAMYLLHLLHYCCGNGDCTPEPGC